MTLKIAFSVDDITPINEHGIKRENGNLKYLIALNKEFGVKFTLFTIPNYKGIIDLTDYKEWVEWLKSKPYFEIAAHGFKHWNKKVNDSVEFYQVDEQEGKELLQKSVNCFREVGVEPKGFKFPGWLFETELINELPKLGFKWLADHYISIYPTKLTNGFYRIPYTLSTENLHSNHYKDILILHSHISVNKQNKNGFTKEHYEQVRDYLKGLIEKNKGDVKFVTFSELIEDAV